MQSGLHFRKICGKASSVVWDKMMNGLWIKVAEKFSLAVFSLILKKKVCILSTLVMLIPHSKSVLCRLRSRVQHTDDLWRHPRESKGCKSETCTSAAILTGVYSTKLCSKYDWVNAKTDFRLYFFCQSKHLKFLHKYCILLLAVYRVAGEQAEHELLRTRVGRHHYKSS